ncbi:MULTISPECIES: oligopeptide ABC transporter permease [Geobacillus]|jgi:oligopeptide transport system permease protein|uniref:Oligopeptide transport system permease protein OppC n=2 Tax=Geobacillus thermodenitrificans TaxID=33940 RepID=A4IL69_GEOTN|nr:MULTISPECIES: oligopeptide ABC transporter permease [Geobacillus]ABO66073.1 Oligopeptide transport system permease protein OppC [Geobacillus thermodenitrificans NG80-2]ARA97492.1 peptide ABC transporter permease [Geobacillus thermodenitrificans]ARP41805.1 Dipeptide transport system permease protein DppC [Geobacillus thermodenitrificans]ATO36817.1 peptide ABC transporter permease [Geobacillus thermodenitrificans]KQB94404.1 Oligopeptide transport system permease protein OppC [Geobacillus sp. 
MAKQQYDQLSPEWFQPAPPNVGEQEKINRPSLTFWHDVWLRLRENKAAIAGMIMIVILALLAIFAPMASERSYKAQNLSHAKLPPKVPVLENISWLNLDGKDPNGVDVYKERGVKEYYWFGTDDLGRDLWVRTWYGTRISLYIGLLAAVIDLFIGIAYGGISGYYGGRVDNAMQRVIEILNGIPYLIVVILFILIFEPGIISITLAMVITGWTTMARIVRGQILKLKNMEYVLAARTLGASNSRLIFKHLIPNVMGPIIITTMFTIPSAIFTEAFLSFIGLGIRPPEASLGSLVNEGYKSIQTYPHLIIIPSIVISLLILSFNLVADGLRDALDPKMRK